jgi:SHS2 domain-containing protein
MQPQFEILEHTADVGFRAWGDTAEELFRQSALALAGIAFPNGAGTDEYPVAVSGHDYESLMVNWLDEILYVFDSAKFAPYDFRVDEVAPTAIRARLIGEPRDAARHQWKVIVKAITYHGIEVVQRNGRWESRVFVDV